MIKYLFFSNLSNPSSTIFRYKVSISSPVLISFQNSLGMSIFTNPQEGSLLYTYNFIWSESDRCIVTGVVVSLNPPDT